MSYIKDLETHPDQQAFPDAKYAISGTPPAAQCTEAVLESTTAVTTDGISKRLTDTGKFTGYNLVGKVCHITASVGGNTGDFDINTNSNDILLFNQDPGNGDPVTYYITDGGELETTRTQQSFADFIHSAGYAYTIKGGVLYTNMPTSEIEKACTITFNPLT